MPNRTDLAAWSPGGVVIDRRIHISAPPATVWAALTVPELMQQWMFETPLDIRTNWAVGGPIVIRGNLHDVVFQNTGTVLQFEPETRLQYTHLSSSSRLPDSPASYTTLTFSLAPLAAGQTELALTLTNFPTEIIYKHLAYYWTVALGIIKRRVEQPGKPTPPAPFP